MFVIYFREHFSLRTELYTFEFYGNSLTQINQTKTNKTKVHQTVLFELQYILLKFCFVHHIVLFHSNNSNSTV